jgi:hypothetical protein
MAAPKAIQPSKNPRIALICELTEQVRIGAIVAGEGKFALMSKIQRNKTRIRGRSQNSC